MKDTYPLNGRVVRRPKGTIVLEIYSKLLASKVIESGSKISLTRHNDGLLIRPNGSMHATIVAGKRLQISVTRMFREFFKTIPLKIPIYVGLETWGLRELLRHASDSPISTSIPSNLIAKRAATRRSRNKFYLDMCSKGMSEVVKRESVRCLLARDGKDFILIKSRDPRARKLTSHTKGRRIQISVPKTLLTNDEVKLLSKKAWLKTWLKFVPSSFNVSFADFYSVKEEKELVDALASIGIEVAPKDRGVPYDIYLPGLESCVEIHNSIPSNDDFGSRHRIRTGQVRLRILEAQHLTAESHIKHAFVVVNELWKKCGFVTDLVSDSNNKVHVLFTNFHNGWAREVAWMISHAMT